MLNKFYIESKFNKFFFAKHKELYALAEQRMNKIDYKHIDEWFESFYGKIIHQNLNYYINITNGYNNYAIPNGVVIGIGVDENGLPKIDEFLVTSTLVHEIGHHYINDMIDLYWEQMEGAANKIFPVVKEKMAKLAYGDAYNTMTEWLINLTRIMYQKTTNQHHMYVRFLKYSDTKNGFIWMFRSVEFMENFNANREKYPTFQDFMPQLVAFLNYTADNFEFVEREYKNSRPYIRNIYPAPGSDITNTTEIVITFSEPMLGASYGFAGPAENTECLPLREDTVHPVVVWSEDGLSCKIYLEPNSIKPGVTYGIKLDVDAYQSLKNFALDEKFTNLIFKQDSK